MNRKLIITLILTLTINSLTAQLSFMQEEISSKYLKGMEFYEKEKYTAAIRFLDDYLKNEADENLNRRCNAEFFSAMASLKLFHPDAEYKMTRFIATYPESELVNDAIMSLGDYFYQNKNYRKAVSYYNRINRILLTGDKLSEFCFRYGYSAMMTGDKPTALLMFNEIKDIDTYYTSPALYYFSHIAYEEGKYETALEGFMKLRDDETFGSVVPFYIVQIMYLHKDYDGILTIAPGLLKSAGKQRAVELYRFIGDAYYNKGNYSEALEYLEKYVSNAKASGREDKYELAYCYYMNGEYDKAIEIFLELTAKPDILSQNVWLILGDCYLKKGDVVRSKFALNQASQLNFDPEIREEALFNYARLLYQTSYSPFGEAIKALQDYIELFPASDRIEEVYNMLISVYTQTKNYKEALASLDKILNKDPRFEEACQRVAFFRGLELFNNMELSASINMFDKSLKYEKYNRQLKARAIYWRGEAYYRLGQYEKAIADYQEFMGIPGSMLLDEYKLVRYNLGYALFNLKDYAGALVHFKSFESSATNVRPDILIDARNRIADCYFIDKKYSEAIEYYNKVIEYGKMDADYALYQKGFAQGLMNNQKGKVETLSKLITMYPSSKYIPGALFERGRAYIILNDNMRGEADFNLIISSYPSSLFAPRAIVQLGLLYFDTGDYQKAITQFKKVIENYSSTPEARYALNGLKNVYVEMNDVESYFAYVKSLKGYADVSLAERDSLLYMSGERLYMTGDCNKATEVFNNYLKEFSNGSFRINALFYLAECYSLSGNKDEALNYYLQVIQLPGSEFLEPALRSAASITYEKQDYLKSFSLYEQLEKITEKPDIVVFAMKGQLKSAWEAGDAEKAISVAEKILKSNNIPAELIREATFTAAKAYYSLNRYDEALLEFKKLAGEITSEQGAESKYRVAEILMMQGNINEAEKVVNEFVNMNTPHQYWMAKAFILLSDISIKKGDIVMARATLQGLKENYPVPDDGILNEVQAKLNAISTKQ